MSNYVAKMDLHCYCTNPDDTDESEGQLSYLYHHSGVRLFFYKRNDCLIFSLLSEKDMFTVASNIFGLQTQTV